MYIRVVLSILERLLNSVLRNRLLMLMLNTAVNNVQVLPQGWKDGFSYYAWSMMWIMLNFCSHLQFQYFKSLNYSNICITHVSNALSLLYLMLLETFMVIRIFAFFQVPLSTPLLVMLFFNNFFMLIVWHCILLC